ncbi:hypothetical protein ROHU_032684 [Labeo rohita]|uniref:Uncharacterized protein n=1 Tax=Labeo rohita TaxID=84645 RepID=A0A498LGZ9_LABRO|nr:hypothetical protein ROHU_032684 [Labeo rohita]
MWVFLHSEQCWQITETEPSLFESNKPRRRDTAAHFDVKKITLRPCSSSQHQVTFWCDIIVQHRSKSTA